MNARSCSRLRYRIISHLLQGGQAADDGGGADAAAPRHRPQVLLHLQQRHLDIICQAFAKQSAQQGDTMAACGPGARCLISRFWHRKDLARNASGVPRDLQMRRPTGIAVTCSASSRVGSRIRPRSGEGGVAVRGAWPPASPVPSASRRCTMGSPNASVLPEPCGGAGLLCTMASVTKAQTMPRWCQLLPAFRANAIETLYFAA